MNQIPTEQKHMMPPSSPVSNLPPEVPNGAPPHPKDTLRRRDAVKIYAFCGLLLILFVMGLLFFLRPSVSETEKRRLAEFPDFNAADILSGEFFSDISTWYSDSFPGREWFISINQAIKELYGIRTVQLVQTQPPQPQTPDDPQTGDPTQGGGTEDAGGSLEQFDTVFVKGDRAFEVYHFTEANSDRYAAVINTAAQKLPDVEIYNLIVPLSYSVNLSEREQQSIGASNVEDAIDYMYGKIDDRVRKIELLSGLLEHKDEELYFRTDHHWTARGAYYAYVAFCNASGQTPLPLETWQKLEFDGFLGSLYSAAGSPASLGNNPDVIEAWIPNSTNEMKTLLYDTRQYTYDFPIIRKSAQQYYSARWRYNCFIAGDHPLIEIRNPNPETTNGKSIVVVKESYGNAFVPFLVDQYEAVYVVDYRFFRGATNKNLQQFVEEVNADQVLFLNYIYATGTGSRLSNLEYLLAD